jgi:hypothetical protein
MQKEVIMGKQKGYHKLALRGAEALSLLITARSRRRHGQFHPAAACPVVVAWWRLLPRRRRPTARAAPPSHNNNVILLTPAAAAPPARNRPPPPRRRRTRQRVSYALASFLLMITGDGSLPAFYSALPSCLPLSRRAIQGQSHPPPHHHIGRSLSLCCTISNQPPHHTYRSLTPPVT